MVKLISLFPLFEKIAFFFYCSKRNATNNCINIGTHNFISVTCNYCIDIHIHT